MVIIYFLLIISISLIMLLFGLKYLNKNLKAKEIILFKLTENSKSFHIDRECKYSICLIGGGTIKNFYASIFSKENEEIEVNESLFKNRFNKNGTLGVSYYDFYIDKTGDYLFKINSFNKLSVKPSMLKSRSRFESEIDKSKISILIKEFSSPYHFILALLLLLLGSMILLLGVVYLLYNFGIISQSHYVGSL